MAEDLGIGDLVFGAADAATSGMTMGGGGGKGDGGSGYMIVFLILAVIGAPIALLSKCVGEAPEAKMIRKVSEMVTPSSSPTDQTKKESIPHWLGRKAKDSVIDFGKGVIGK